MSKIERINYSSGLPTEPLRGYSRAVRSGSHLYISATGPINEKGDVIGVNDPYVQTRYIIQVLRDILRETGFNITDVVRTKMYVTKMSAWNDFARAHLEAFDKVRPVSSIVEVRRLMDSRVMVEMEVDAILHSDIKETHNIKIVEDKSSIRL